MVPSPLYPGLPVGSGIGIVGRSMMFRFLLWLPVLVFSLSSLSAGGAERPNVIFVLIDDMGWADFSCFGNTEAETPNIDRLAAEGIAFEQFYVNSPICSPSRVAFSTGQYPARWGITSYLNNRKDNARRGVRNWLDLSAPMLARYLHEAGYATGHFGKWHMGGQRDVDEAPLIVEYGFDESITNFEGLGARVLPLKFYPDTKKPVPHNLGSDSLGHGPVIWHNRAFVTEKFVQAATAFARYAAGKDRPFYLNLWPDDVHTPVTPPVKKWGDGSDRHLYLEVLMELDRQLGPLFDLVRGDERLRENTIVLICSDNGPEVGFGSAGRLRGNKATLFEAGVRSSLVVWAPGLMAREAMGSRNGESVFSAVDLAPSLLSLTGTAAPEGVVFDGEDMSEVLMGRSRASRVKPLYFRRPPDRKVFRQYEGLPDLSVRKGDWKCYCDYDGSNAMLYDLGSDVGEERDVAAEYPQVVDELVTELVRWNESMPQDNGLEVGREAMAALKEKGKR